MSLTETQFRNLSADDKWQLYLKTKVDKDSFDCLTQKLSQAVEKIESCESRITALESQLAVNQTVNTTLQDSIRELNRRLNRLDQYGRRENVIISGVPDNVRDLESKSIKLFGKIGVEVNSSDIVACHPIKKKGSVIVRFANRKNVDRVLKASKKLKNTDTTDVWGQNCVNYINSNLSPVNLKLRWLAKI